MRALLSRRTVRHVLVGLLPLLVVGTAVIVVLAVRFAGAAAPVREATGRAVATVERSGLGADGRAVELRWTDERGARHTSLVRASGPGDVPAGAQVELRYVPSDPGRVYVAGDDASARLRDLGFGLILTPLLLVVVVVASAVHAFRRLAAERRQGSTVPVSYARSRRGLLRRSWLVLEDHGRQLWVPVHWEPVLTRLLAKTPATVHGRPGRDKVLAVDVEGSTVWQAAGRVRAQPPRGEITMEAPAWSTSAKRRAEAQAAVESSRAPDVGLARQLRTDGALLVAAPLIGLLWAYVDSSGLVSLLVATALAAAVLLWLPTVIGSDPT